MVKTKASEALRLMVDPPRVSQVEIAEACNVSQQAVSAWAQGRMKPTPDRMRLLQDRFGIPMQDWTDSANGGRRKQAPSKKVRVKRAANG